MSKLMIVGAGLMQSPVIEKAKHLGHIVITVDRDINAIGNKYADFSLEIDTNDFDSIFSAAIKYDIDGILTTSDYPVKVIAKVCKELNLKGLTVYAADVCTNKFLLREHLKKNKFNVPKYKIVKDIEDIRNIDFFPAVIKPLDSSGSRGIKKIYSTKDINFALSDAQSYSRSGSVIIEEFIQGREYSVETLSQNSKTHIIAITEKTVKGKDGLFFVEDRHIVPANLNDSEIKLIHETIVRLIKTLNLGDSATHTELKLNEKGIYIIEVGARLGGDFITSDLVPLATGIDMLENVILLALGSPIKVNYTMQRYSGIQFIQTDNYEHTKNCLKQSSQLYERFQIDPFVQRELKSSFDRLGYFIAVRDNREDLMNVLDFNK